MNDMASALSTTPPSSKPTSSTTGVSGGGTGMSLLSSSSSAPGSNLSTSPQLSRPGFQQPTPPPRPTKVPTHQPTLSPMSSSFTHSSTLQPSKYTPPPAKQTSMGMASGTGIGPGYTPPTVRSQQPMSANSGLGDMGLFTGGTGQTSQTGLLQPMMATQSNFSGMSSLGNESSNRNTAPSNSLFSGMQTGGGGFNPPSQVKRSTPSSGMNGSSGLFTGMQVNSSQPAGPSMSGAGGIGGGGILQPLVPTQQQPSNAQSIGSGWSSNINTQPAGSQMNSSMYGGAQPQNQAIGGWSSNVAGNTNNSLNPGGGGGGWSQNIGGGSAGMGMQQVGMGHTPMQSGMGMGQSTYNSGASWSTNIAGGSGNTGFSGSSAPPTAVGLMMGGMGQPLVPQTIQPSQQQTANKPAPGANPFADLNFLA